LGLDASVDRHHHAGFLDEQFPVLPFIDCGRSSILDFLRWDERPSDDCRQVISRARLSLRDLMLHACRPIEVRVSDW
jgi:hypothetical protein